MQEVHLKAPGCWMNDPNGFIYYCGQYHLFYQCFPYEPRWGRMHWGHAVSKDLVHWEHLKIALFPSKFDDKDGCFSGSAVEFNGGLYLFYTGVRYTEENKEDTNLCIRNQFVSSQMLITSKDGLNFNNIRDKKTILSPIENPFVGDKTHTRDPNVWRGETAWYMVVGSTESGKGKLLFYQSNDLSGWKLVNMVQKDKIGGWMWECPDYFEIQGKKVLLISILGILKDGKQEEAQSVCTIVEFEEEFCEMKIPDTYQYLDYGFDLYAPQTTLDEMGRRTVIAWIRMPEPVEELWNGMFCIPRVIEVEDGHLYFRPHPNVKQAYTKEITALSQASNAGCRLVFNLVDGDGVNIGGYRILREGKRICTDRSEVFGDFKDFRREFKTPELRSVTDVIPLDIYVDQNLIEVYVNDGEYVISNVVYGLCDVLEMQQSKNVAIYTTE